VPGVPGVPGVPVMKMTRSVVRRSWAINRVSRTNAKRIRDTVAARARAANPTDFPLPVFPDGLSDGRCVPAHPESFMPADHAQIRTLVERARTGDRSAQQTLWEGHRRWIAAIVLAHRPRAAEVDDLMQDVAERFVAGIDTLRDAEAFRPWLRQIILNVCRGFARRHHPAASIDQAMHEASGDTLASTLRDTGRGSGDDEVTRREAANRLLRQVDSLPPEYREPLLLRALRAMSYQQIGALLDLPVTTVETRLARARRMLRGEMADALGHAEGEREWND